MKKEKFFTFLTLHVVLLVYSISGVMSKNAAKYPFLSFKFILFYGGLIVILGLYAIAWQQILKRIPVTTAYANKALMAIWTLLWGKLFFNEAITWGKVIGILIIICGVILLSTEKGETVDD